MAYNDLSECTVSNEERLAEKDRIVERLNREDLTPKESEFITKMMTANYISVKQLFWLRDINAKY